MRRRRLSSRANPYELFSPSDLKDPALTEELAQDIALLEKAVWGSLNPSMIQGYYSFKSIMSDADCFVGISYPEGARRSLLSYIVAEEINPYTADYQAKLARCGAILGLDRYEDIMEVLPGKRIVYIQDWTRSNSSLAKEENTGMYNAFTQTMMDLGIGFLRDSRSDTSYKALKRLESQGRVKILADFVTDDQNGVPVHTCFGYYK